MSTGSATAGSASTATANRYPSTSTLFDTAVPVEDEHDHVDPTAATSRWDGYRLNLSDATGCLAVPRYQTRDTRCAQQVS